MRFIFLLTALFCAVVISCSSGPRQKKTAPAPQPGIASDNASIQHLINDYAGMKEDENVSWAWVENSFRLDQCSSVKIQPVLNYSSCDYPQAQQSIEKGLADAVVARKAGSGDGAAVLVNAAITGMHGKVGLLKRFSPSFEDIPTVEIEVTVTEAQSGHMFVKMCHMARGEDIGKALDKLLQDMGAFFKKI